MRSGKATATLFLKWFKASLAVAVGVLLLSSPALALTWEEINQQLARCFALTNETINLVGRVKSTNIRDDKSKKKVVAAIKKAEHNLGRVIDIYQNLYQADLPPAKVMPSILTDIKSSIYRNLGLTRLSLQQAQSLRRRVDKEGVGIVGSGMQMELVIDLQDLRYHTSLLQQHVQARNLR
jgi:hypothetical protein